MAERSEEPAALDLSLEPARVTDAAPIAQISRDVIEAGLMWMWRPGAIARLILRQDAEVVVARRGGAVVGAAVMQFLDEEAHLLLLGVLPEHHGRGIGSALMRWLERMAETAMIRVISLEVRAKNQPARASYRRLGYAEVDSRARYYQGREDAVIMKRWLY